ncbi:MAG TPA: hypothetical protein DGG95_11345 [Cytophagales bacterium]|jgi:hypothetical protein|nr:hypothetical protein [Cytophagales bacterium]
MASTFFSKKDELNVLVNLAAIDRFIDVKEVKLIHMIGKSNGISAEEIDEMIKNPKTVLNLSLITEDEKFEHLYYLILMMKSDGRVLKNEIDFCETIAQRLGYAKGVVGALSKHVYSDLAVHSNRKLLRQISEKYLEFRNP